MNLNKKSIVSTLLALVLGSIVIVATTSTYVGEQNSNESFVWEGEQDRDIAEVETASDFTPPHRKGRSGNVMRNVMDNELADFIEYGIIVSQGNIYYNEQLVREVVFYTTYSFYNDNGLIVLRSSDTSGNLDIYVLIPGTPTSMSGADIGNFIRFDIGRLDLERSGLTDVTVSITMLSE